MDELKEAIDIIADRTPTPPNREMMRLRDMLDGAGIEWHSGAFGDPRITYWKSNGVEWCAIERDDGRLVVNMGIDVTPEQAITATVGPTLDQDLQQALDFMRIWITDDAHLGESDISYELEKAEGLRNLEAIEQAIAATVGNGTDLASRLREVHGLHAFAELFGFDWHDESDWSWHDVACAMADAIDAMVGVGTCRNVSDPPSGFLCSECGWGDFDEPTHLLKDAKHYPNCGERIEVDE